MTYTPNLYFLMVPLVLLCSLISAFILVSIYKLINKVVLHFKKQHDNP